MDIGKHLQENRLRRGIALSQIAQSTKLSTTTLQYIERNELGSLPGGIFVRSYLRAFAAAVGANPDDVVRAYVERFPVVPVANDQPRLRDAFAAHHRFLAGLVTAGLSILLALVVYGVFAQTPDPLTDPLPAVLEARPLDLFISQAIAAELILQVDRSEGPSIRSTAMPAGRSVHRKRR